MVSNILKFCFIFLLAFQLQGQEHLIVFDKTGKIVKNYGYNPHNSNHINFNMTVDGANNKEMNNYFVLYQWRNEYNYQTNFTLNEPLNILRNNKGKLSLSIDKSNNNSRYFCYQLVKLNDKGKGFLKKTDTISLNSLWKWYIEDINLDLEKFYNTGQSLLTVQNQKIKFDGLEKKIKTKQKEKLEEFETYQKFNREKDSLDNLLKSKTLIIEKLAAINEATTTPRYIDDIGKEITELNLQVFLIKKSIDSLKKEKNRDLKSLEEDLEQTKKEIKKAFRTKTENKIDYIKEPLWEILHHGIIISKNQNTHEIVYDVNFNSKFKEPQLEIGRLSPNLPQLTTDSELYCHIINFKPEDLKTNPFIVSMEVEQSEPVEVESPNNIKGLETTNNFGFDNLNEIITSFNNKSIEATPEGLSDSLNILPDLVKLIDDFHKKDEDEFKDDDLNEFQSKLRSYVVQIDALANYKLQIEGIDINNKYESLKQISLEIIKTLLDKFLNFIKKIAIAKVSNIPKFTEFTVKYPRPFEANKIPTIKLKSNQYTIENYLEKVENGKSQKTTYDITLSSKELVSDALPPVHRLYRFSISAGALLTNSTSYNYEQVPISNSTVSDLKEFKQTSWDVRPSITFSTYFAKQDLNVNEKAPWIRTSHFDISIDYADGKLLDNFYFGLGVEPIRNLHIASGVRLGQVERVSMDKYDPFLNNIEESKTNRLGAGFYCSISLGFDLVPSFLKLITN